MSPSAAYSAPTWIINTTNNIGRTQTQKQSKSVPVMLKLLPPDAEICGFDLTSYQQLLQATFFINKTWPASLRVPCGDIVLMSMQHSIYSESAG